MRLKKTILHTSLKMLKMDTFIQNVVAIQRCPFTENPKYLEQLRTELRKCCNASDQLIVTQNNTRIDDILNYETQQKKTIKVDKKIHQMLPNAMPFPRKPLKECAVVGNGGILLNSCCGSEIDRADYVFRFNLPPMNQTYDVGTKLDLVTANPSILYKRFSALNEKRKPFADMMKVYGSALILMPAFSFVGNTDISFKVLYTVEDFGLDPKVVFFNPEYLKNLAVHWKMKGLNVRRLSSGLMLISTALELCEKVSLYGFWPFSQDLQGNRIPHHYYDNIIPNAKMHSMPDEFFFYAQMHSQGALRLNLGKCF
ncbi:hypothetical protein FKM82_018116 [Ascaphus truei]